jgi:hypothetical protein
MSMPVENSIKQMALMRDGVFVDRLIALMSKVAAQVLTEQGMTAHHAARAAYATKVTTQPGATATVAGPQIVMAPQIINQTSYDEGTKVATCNAPDAVIEAEIKTLWNSLAGVDTPS